MLSASNGKIAHVPGMFIEKLFVGKPTFGVRIANNLCTACLNKPVIAFSECYIVIYVKQDFALTLISLTMHSYESNPTCWTNIVVFV